MGYFPMFVQLEGKHCLIVGGGNVAYRKAQQLIGCGANLTIVAMKYVPELEEFPKVEAHHREFCETDLDGKQLVIAATGDHALNKKIAMYCQERKIPINAVDDIDNCSFLFPALIRKGDLCIGISTGGSSPSAAKYIREKIQEMVSSDDNLEGILAFLEEKRPLIRQNTHKTAERSNLYSKLFLKCMEKHAPLEEHEFQRFLDCAGMENDGNE